MTASGGEVGRLSIVGGVEVRWFYSCTLFLLQLLKSNCLSLKWMFFQVMIILVILYRLVHFAVGLEVYAFLGQLETWMLESL